MKVEPHELDDYVPLYSIVRCTPHKPIRGKLCGDGPLFFREHFYGQRTMPCRGTEICPACSAGMCSRISGYTWFIPDGRLCFRILNVPYSGCMALRAIVESDRYEYSGLEFECKRRGSTIRSAVSISVASKVSDTPANGPQPPSLESQLFKIWGISSLA